MQKLAAVPAGSEVDPCCCGCPSAETLDVVISGIAICGCFFAQSTDFPSVTTYWLPTNMVGVNGAFSFTADGPFIGGRSWSAVIGTIDVEQFEGPPEVQCTVPVDPPNSATVDVLATITCLDGLGLFANIGIELPYPNTGAQIFATLEVPFTYFQFGDTVANLRECVLNPIGYYGSPAAGGQLTASLP